MRRISSPRNGVVASEFDEYEQALSILVGGKWTEDRVGIDADTILKGAAETRAISDGVWNVAEAAGKAECEDE